MDIEKLCNRMDGEYDGEFNSCYLKDGAHIYTSPKGGRLDGMGLEVRAIGGSGLKAECTPDVIID